MGGISKMHRSIISTTLLVLSLPTTIVSQSNITITASTCVAPDAYTQCDNDSLDNYNMCALRAGANQDDLLACICVAQLNRLNCAMESCWNVVYGCEYQQLAQAYTYSCASPVPFFPAPDNAPSGCSCNLGYVEYNATFANLQYKHCVDASGTDIDRNDGCTCCSEAMGYAACVSSPPPSSLPFLSKIRL
jgi:hypothetical protein